MKVTIREVQEMVEGLPEDTHILVHDEEGRVYELADISFHQRFPLIPQLSLEVKLTDERLEDYQC